MFEETHLENLEIILTLGQLQLKVFFTKSGVRCFPIHACQVFLEFIVIASSYTNGKVVVVHFKIRLKS